MEAAAGDRRGYAGHCVVLIFEAPGVGRGFAQTGSAATLASEWQRSTARAAMAAVPAGVAEGQWRQLRGSLVGERGPHHVAQASDGFQRLF